MDPYDAMEPLHQEFLSQIVAGLTAKQPTSELKGQVLNYMMVHNGVSTWCVPLKKLVETIQ